MLTGPTVQALLDSASKERFCTERLSQMLGVKGTPLGIVLDTVNGEDSTQTAEVNLEVNDVSLKWSRALMMN